MPEGSSAPEKENTQPTTINSALGFQNFRERIRKRILKGRNKDRTIRESILQTANQINIERAEVAERESTTDFLTGLHNKKWFEEELERAIAEARRYETPLRLIYWDIDHFKGINDKFGHPVGDDILRALGKIGSREEEQIARIGGEEFAQIIRRGLENEDLVTLLSRYSSNFKKISRSILGYEATLSFGIAELNPDDTSSSFKERADKALFDAKESGRDRATLFRGPSISPLRIPIEIGPQVPKEVVV